MKSLSSLFIVSACATLLSGCYMDRQPTMTLEDRAMASDKEIAEYEKTKKAQVTPKPVDETRGPESGFVAVKEKSLDEINTRIPPGERRYLEFSGKRFMTGTWSVSAGRNVLDLEVLLKSETGGWRKIACATFDVKGSARLVTDDKAGVITLLVAEPGSSAEREVFRYDLSAAL
jgi:hypothetical protein